MSMWKSKALAWVLTTIVASAFVHGCSDEEPVKGGTGGKAGSGGSSGSGPSSTGGSAGTATTGGGSGGTSGSGGRGGTGGSSGSGGGVTGGSAGSGGSAGPDAAGGNGGAGGSSGAGGNGGTDGPDGSAGSGGEPIDAGPIRPDGSHGVSYKFDVSGDLLGWHYAPYGSTTTTQGPTNPPSDPNNLANLCAPLAWDSDDANGAIDASGSLKETVPFRANGDRIDAQAFSTGTDVRDWTGYIITAKVKLVSGGNIAPSCPLQAWLYVSTAPSYATQISPPVDLVTGNWVTVTYDLALSSLDLSQINQMGIQITTGTCVPPAPEGGPDGAPETDASSASDVSVSDVSPADDASGEVEIADAGTDASDEPDAAAPPPPTATTAVILIDDVIVSVK